MRVTQDMREKGILFWELGAKRVSWCLGLITSYVNVWHPSGLEAIVGELEKTNTGKTFMNVLSGVFNQILENLMISWGTNLRKSWRCYAGKSLNSTGAWLFWVKCPNDSTWCKSPESSPCLVLMLISGLYLVWMLYLFSCLNLCLCEALKISEHLRVVWTAVIWNSSSGPGAPGPFMRDTLLFCASYNCGMSGNGSGCMLYSLSMLLLL